MSSGDRGSAHARYKKALKKPIYTNVAKVGGLHSQGAKSEAVVRYCELLATPDLAPSCFPEGFKKVEKNRTDPGMYR